MPLVTGRGRVDHRSRGWRRPPADRAPDSCCMAGVPLGARPWERRSPGFHSDLAQLGVSGHPGMAIWQPRKWHKDSRGRPPDILVMEAEISPRGWGGGMVQPRWPHRPTEATMEHNWPTSAHCRPNLVQSMVHCCPTMVHRRSTEGPTMVHCRSTAGPTMVHCRANHSPTMVHCRSTAGPTMVHCRSNHGPLQVQAWSTSGPLQGQP